MANLASVIMEGVDFTPSFENNYDFSDSVVAESSYVDSAVSTLFSDIMEAEQGWMVADVVGAATVIRESKMGNDIDPTAVVEGVIASGIAKIKAAFAKFIAKIKEYYKRVINWFKAMFSNGQDFAKNYGKLIKEKAGKVKGFSYKGYKYTYSTGKSKADGDRNKIKTKIDSAIGGFDAIKDCSTKSELRDKLVQLKVISGTFKEDDATSSTEVVDGFVEKDLGYSDISDMRSELTDSFRDGDTSEGTITDFSENSVDEMLKVLKDPNKPISEIEKQQVQYEKQVNAVIKKLNNMEKADDTDAAGNVVSNASYLSSCITGYLNLYKVPCEVEIGALKEMGTKFLSVLKKFYSYKGNKDRVAQMDSYIPFEMSVIESSEPDEEEGDGNGKSDVEEGGCGKGGKSCTESAISSILDMASNFNF